MSDEPTTIDWNLHMTRGHTPMKDWEKRNSLDHYFSAHADEWLVRVAPMFREEVIRLRASIERAISTLRSQPNDLEDGPDYHRDLLSFLDGAICHAVDILEGKE